VKVSPSALELLKSPSEVAVINSTLPKNALFVIILFISSSPLILGVNLSLLEVDPRISCPTYTKNVLCPVSFSMVLPNFIRILISLPPSWVSQVSETTPLSRPENVSVNSWVSRLAPVLSDVQCRERIPTASYSSLVSIFNRSRASSIRSFISSLLLLLGGLSEGYFRFQFDPSKLEKKKKQQAENCAGIPCFYDTELVVGTRRRAF
jgi:hypothetical protein